MLLKIGCADAAVSQTDFCIGRVLNELERLGLENSTLVVAHSDHVRTLPFPKIPLFCKVNDGGNESTNVETGVAIRGAG